MTASTEIHADTAGEPLEVVRIKLTRTGGSAVISELRSADLLLLEWAESRDERVLDYEVCFEGGYLLYGRYDLRRGKRGKPSLSRVIRRVFRGLARVPAIWPNGIRFLPPPTSDMGLELSGFYQA